MQVYLHHNYVSEQTVQIFKVAEKEIAILLIDLSCIMCDTLSTEKTIIQSNSSHSKLNETIKK